MKKNRRQFIRNAGLLSLSPLLLSMGCKSTKSTVNEAMKAGFTLDDFGIQLWTVRDFMSKDPKKTLADLSAYGYNHIESFQGDQGIFWGMKGKEFKAFLMDHNMTIKSSHCDPQYTVDPKKEDEFKKVVEDANMLGMKYLVNPFMGFLKTLDEFKAATDGLNRCGEIAQDAGIQYCYHNHSYSFRSLDGERPQDVMMKGTAGGPVGFEMDIYWVVAAGEDPIEWFKKYPGRWPLSHVKDRYKPSRLNEIEAAEGSDEMFGVSGSCVLGTGQIDFDKVLPAAKAQGMEQYIVEQERYDDMTSMQAAMKDAAFMKKYRV